MEEYTNLPPGVTEDMLPGNRPEDEIAEAWLRKLVDLVVEARKLGIVDIDEAHDLLEDVWKFTKER